MATKRLQTDLVSAVLVVFCLFFFNPANAGTNEINGKPTVYCSKGNSDCQTKVDVLGAPLTSRLSAFTRMPQRLGLCLFKEPDFIPSTWYDSVAGRKFTPSELQLTFGQDEYDKVICEQEMSLKQATLLKSAIQNQYRHNMWMDDFPMAYCYETIISEKYCIPDIPIGFYTDSEGEPHGAWYSSSWQKSYLQPNSYYLYSHLSLKVFYHPLTHNTDLNTINITGNIVRISVTPKCQKKGTTGSSSQELVRIPGGDWNETVNLVFTFDVMYKELGVKWKDRWRQLWEQTMIYSVVEVHLVNSSIMNFFIILCVVGWLCRAHPYFRKCHLCLKRWNDRWRRWQLFDEDGWKDMDRDALRAPPNKVWLAALCGNSVQIISTAVIVLGARYSRLISPVDMGETVKLSVWSYGVCGIIGGFVSRHLYFYLPRENKEDITFKTVWAIQFRSTVVTAILSNFSLASTCSLHFLAESNVMMGMRDVMIVLALLIGLSLPCSIVGSFLSSCVTACRFNLHIIPDLGTEVEPTPTPVPRQPCYVRRVFCLLLQGICPFSVIFIPTYLCLNAVWFNQYLNSNGSLLLCLLFLLICSAGFTCFTTLAQLCKKNHKWWWSSMMIGVATAIHFIVYIIIYFFSRIEMRDTLSCLLFFNYVFIASLILGIIIGPFSFMGCYLFVRRMYYHLELSKQHEANIATANAKLNFLPLMTQLELPEEKESTMCDKQDAPGSDVQESFAGDSNA